MSARLPFPVRISALLAAALCVGAATNTATCRAPSQSTPIPTPSPSDEIFTTSDGFRFFVNTIATGLHIPWGLVFAPDGRMFFTERDGFVRILQNGAILAEPALALTDVVAVGESGALGLALHPDFARTHYVYLAYTGQGRD